MTILGSPTGAFKPFSSSTQCSDPVRDPAAAWAASGRKKTKTLILRVEPSESTWKEWNGRPSSSSRYRSEPDSDRPLDPMADLSGAEADEAMKLILLLPL